MLAPKYSHFLSARNATASVSRTRLPLAMLRRLLALVRTFNVADSTAGRYIVTNQATRFFPPHLFRQRWMWSDAAVVFFRSPVLRTGRTGILYFAHVSFYFFPAHFFQRPSTDILETFPHDVALVVKEVLLCQFPKSAPWQKWGANNCKFRQISRLTAT